MLPCTRLGLSVYKENLFGVYVQFVAVLLVCVCVCVSYLPSHQNRNYLF